MREVARSDGGSKIPPSPKPKNTQKARKRDTYV